MDCDTCPNFDPEKKDVNTEWPEADPDYFRFYQSHQKGGEIMTTKICSNPNCKHKGEPQDIGRFGKNAGCKDGHEGQCYDCKSQQAKDRAAAKAAGTYVPRNGLSKTGKKKRLEIIKDVAAGRGKKIEGSAMPDAVSSVPVIDMTGNNEIYRTAAAIFVRSIERKFMESVAAELKE